MSADALRRWLLVLCMLTFAGLPMELVLEQHYGSPPQVIPFVLSGLGFVACSAVLVSTHQVVCWVARGVFVVNALGGIFGVWEHLEHNVAFAMEIRPNASTMELVLEGLMGANPLLAPGAFVLVGVMGWLGTMSRS